MQAWRSQEQHGRCWVAMSSRAQCLVEGNPQAYLQVCPPQLLQLILIQKLLHALLHRRARAAAAAELAGLPALLGPDCLQGKGMEGCQQTSSKLFCP